MKKLIMLKGLPASGKSTYAKEMVRVYGYKRVNRDELRDMIDLGKYSPENEQFIKDIQDAIITLFSDDFNVVVDNTNLKPEDTFHFKELAYELSMKFEVKEFDTSLEECIRRDSFRSNPIGEKVIRDMYEKYMEPK